MSGDKTTAGVAFDLLDACARASQMLLSLKFPDEGANRPALHLASADGSDITKFLHRLHEPLSAVFVEPGGPIWGVSSSNHLWSNAQRLSARPEWQQRPERDRTPFSRLPPRPWYRYALPLTMSIATAFTLCSPNEALVGDFEGRILSIDLSSGRCVEQADLSKLGEFAAGTPYRFVADAEGSIVAFGTMDYPVARIAGRWAPVSVPGLPDRPRFIRGRWKTADGRLLACTSDRFLMFGSSRGFDVIAALEEEPFDFCVFAGRTYVATMGGLVELDDTGAVVHTIATVAPILMVPTETALFAYDISPDGEVGGKVVAWRTEADGRLGELQRIRVQQI